MALSLTFGAVSDIGRVRKKNDDSGYVGPWLIAVADGMGGAPAGDVASTIAIQTLKRLDAPPPDDMLQALAGTVLLANERLAEVIDDDPTIEGTGTTITAALFDGTRIGVAHLGDSRGFLWRDGALERITRDHSWVQSLIDEGRITEAEAKTHSHRSLLLKVLDGRHDNEPDLSTLDVRAGDRILICSDGLTGFVGEDRISDILRTGTAQSVATELTVLALESGSTDNVTVLVADVVEVPDDAPVPPAARPRPMLVGAAGDRQRRPLRGLRLLTPRDELEPHETLFDPANDPEALRYAPRPPRRYLWLRRSLFLGLALVVVIAGLTVAYRWSQTQYYVGADGTQVAIYQGVDAQLPGISMSHVVEQESLRLRDLPAFRRSQVVAGMATDSRAKAEQIIAQLRGFARICADQTTTTPTTMPAPPTTTTTTPTKTPGGTTTPTTPTTPTPTTPTGTAPTGTTAPVTTIGPPSTLVSPGGSTGVTECAGVHRHGPSTGSGAGS